MIEAEMLRFAENANAGAKDLSKRIFAIRFATRLKDRNLAAKRLRDRTGSQIRNDEQKG